MAGEGLHIPVDADDKDLRKLAAALRSVKQEAQAAAKAVRDTGNAAKHPGGGGGGGHGGHGGHHGGMLHGLARLTRGTELGHFAHMGANLQSVGGAGMGMMALGGFATAAVLAGKAITEFSNRAVEAAKKEAEVRLELAHAIQSSVKSADAKAIGAFHSNKDALLSLAGMGGDALVGQAKDFAGKAGPGGIKAFASIAGMHGGFQESNLEGARTAAETGQISIDKAADMIASGKVRSGMDPMETAAAILSQESGHRITASDVEEMAKNLGGSKLGQAAGRFEKGEGAITAAGIDRFTTGANGGSITAAQGAERGELASPTTAAVLEVAKKMDEQLEVMKAGADAQWRIVRWFEHGLGTYGMGSGSLRDDYDRARSATVP
jgi:hypothetical protein